MFMSSTYFSCFHDADGQNTQSLETPSESPVNIVVLGSTGSIGRSTLEVIAASGGTLRPIAIAAHRSIDRLAEQMVRFRPAYVVVTDLHAADEFLKTYRTQIPPKTELLVGEEGISQAIRDPRTQMVLSAIVGFAGLRSTWEAVDAGRTVALANKESLVVGGELITKRAAETGAKILPVDSEHSAIFQTLRCGRRDELRRILLTASGGPFRTTPVSELRSITPAQALAHPTWQMGPKVTIDSATLINKALEIIEAKWLFGLSADEIDVVIHPQSIVHSMVEYRDGSVIAQLGQPDMRLPIHHALYQTRRPESVAARLDWTSNRQLEFFAPDRDRFPAIGLGLRVVRDGGISGAVLNAADEIAVVAFLNGILPFDRIVPMVENELSQYTNRPVASLTQLAQVDAAVREEVRSRIC